MKYEWSQILHRAVIYQKEQSYHLPERKEKKYFQHHPNAPKAKQNFSAIRPAVWRPFQKKTHGGCITPPPLYGRGLNDDESCKRGEMVNCLDNRDAKAQNKNRMSRVFH